MTYFSIWRLFRATVMMIVMTMRTATTKIIATMTPMTTEVVAVVVAPTTVVPTVVPSVVPGAIVLEAAVEVEVRKLLQRWPRFRNLEGLDYADTYTNADSAIILPIGHNLVHVIMVHVDPSFHTWWHWY